MLTNNTGIPISMAVWLAMDEYSHTSAPYTISATSLLKPIREVVLARQNMTAPTIEDISTKVASRIGSDLHAGLEKAWITHYESSLTALGYPANMIKNIKINPKKEDIGPDTIPIYVEGRTEKKVGKWTVTGQYDLVIEGRLEDFKSTGTYSYVMQSNADKYIQQGSIYRWLNPDIITSDVMAIQYIFTDWNMLESIKNPKYPKSKLLEQQFQLMPIQETESFVSGIINTITLLEDKPQEELPTCTPDELWIKPSVFKYYKDPNKTARSTKNFDTSHEAQARLSKDGGVGIVKEVKGQVVKCKYCSVASLCTQAQGYVNTGLLKL